MGYIILYIALVIGLIFLVREIVMWYWKINELIKNQNDQKHLLDSILEELKKSNNK